MELKRLQEEINAAIGDQLSPTYQLKLEEIFRRYEQPKDSGLLESVSRASKETWEKVARRGRPKGSKNRAK